MKRAKKLENISGVEGSFLKRESTAEIWSKGINICADRHLGPSWTGQAKTGKKFIKERRNRNLCIKTCTQWRNRKSGQILSTENCVDSALKWFEDDV